ncbi:cold shock and DUF1294 domain-containing protein [Marinobacterium marinum]|uniref:DUF1294 domain-containing protein n=1 Tax=Marinobacterium marinum TaxID=2756129 RepID=A0A7W1X0H7_9GAMM|nr:cold shock and DUF1294 domain-containing protein [Marinobacterium marinum]MBA4503481.1 DUF1294 domain-containing protein [Marinobacterium marinum]
MAMKGRIKKWNADKGFGFIQPLEGGDDLFFHVSAMRDRSLLPQINQLVTFEPGTDKDNRPRAESVVLAGTSVRRQHKTQHSSSHVIVPVLALFVVLGVVSMIGLLPWQLPVLMGFLSLWTYIVYAIDKSAAQADRRRTPESTLHLLALLGGWPGALCAQNLLRHKSVKAAFRNSFWWTVVINLGLMGFLASEPGQQLWGALLQ